MKISRRTRSGRSLNSIAPLIRRFARSVLFSLFIPAFVLPLSSAVTEAWVQRYNGPASSSDIGRAVKFDSEGNVAVIGSSWNGQNSDFYTVKYAATNGTVIWSNRYNGPGNNSSDQASDLAVDAQGNVIVSGYSGTNSSSFDLYTAKYAAATGALLWERRSRTAPNMNDVPSATLGIDSQGNVIVTGAAGGSGGNDYYTAKYAGTNGTLLWEQRYNSFSDGNDGAQAVVVDLNGNVIVTGYSASDYYTAKYASANGSLLWERRYTGPPTGANYDIANAVAVDTNGNVFVTGYSVSSFGVTGFDYYTAKYAANTGAILWERRYDGSAHGNDEANSVAVDAQGNAIVTGWSHNGTNHDYATVKYSGLDGEILWERRYDHPAGNNDLAYAVAVDSLNNIVVTGRADGTNTDYYTVSYAAADGAVVWERYFDGWANKFDAVISPRALAIGPNGRVAVTGVSTGPIGIIDFADFATVVYRENFAPVITCPSNIVTNCTGNSQAIVHFTIEAADESGVPPLIVCSPPSGSAFPVGQTLVTCTAMDSDQLSNSCTFTVTVLDLVPPVVNCPSNQTVEFSTDQGAMIEYSATATDLCDSQPLLTGVPPSGSVLPVGTTTVQCTARDASGNSNTCSFTVTVLGARGTKYNRLSDLVTLLPGITNRSDRQKLERAIKHLLNSLEPRWWIDEAHVTRRHGQQVFQQEMLAARNLCALSLAEASAGTHETVQYAITRILQADRLLASIAIQDASEMNVPLGKIERANQFMLRADRAAEAGNCAHAIKWYRRAWRVVR
jgi:hypothetical protein